MTHKSIDAQKRKAAGVKDSLIRLSVGLEDARDLINDIETALTLVSATHPQKAKHATQKEKC